MEYDVAAKSQVSATPVSIVMMSPILREGLKKLANDNGLAVTCPQLDTGPEAVLATVRASGTDLVIFDGAACEHHPEAVNLLGRAAPDCRVVILTDSYTMHRIPEETLAVADGLLSPHLSPETMLQSLQLVRLGSHVVSPPLARLPRDRPERLAEAGPSPSNQPSGPARDLLSARETEILQHLAVGCSNKGIARDLGITEATVKVHVKGLLRKIRASNRTQAAIWAIRNGVHAGIS